MIVLFLQKNTSPPLAFTGTTHSGKGRRLVLQTIGTLALFGESMVLSDPKGEL